MTIRDGYCSQDDISLGNIPLPSYIDPALVVADAADEIDSQIGFLYETPINVTLSGTVPKPVKLLLKRINISLATGRLILTLDATGENKNLNAYGQSLITQALEALASIAKGDPILPGVPSANPDDEVTSNLPQLANKDNESYVEAFYERIANPWYLYPPVIQREPFYGAPYPGLVR